jgi:hypothetical protein
MRQEFGTNLASATRRKVLSHKGLEQEGGFSVLMMAILKMSKSLGWYKHSTALLKQMSHLNSPIYILILIP